MKYTVTIIDTEEKFREKFGSEPHWIISTPYGKRKKPLGKNIENENKPKKAR